MNTELPKNSCPKCGAEIPPEAPQGLCPKCVMSGVATESGGAPPEINAGDAPSLERVAAAFPNLEVIELVGRGGMGFVYKARQPRLGRYVALKLLPDKLAADPHFAERFNREGRVLARLNHPSIVSVYDFGQTEHFYYLMMEFVDGVNLRQAMRAGRFSPAEALAVVPTICEALQYAHDQGVLHRDIKPENILLDTQGKVKIADFGIAKLVGEEAGANVTLTMTGSSLGTPHYMAPEQLEKPSEVDHRADIYSLGVVLYEMLTGELPIGRFEAPSHKTPVGKGVDDVVFRALEKNREKRQHSANEFKTQVQTAGKEAVPPKLNVPRGSKSGSRLCWPAAIGAALVGLSAVAAVVALILLSLGRQGMGVSFTMLIFLGIPLMLAAVAGTILGWVGLTQIKRSNGALYGTPMALFAAVAYPFGLPALVIFGVPMFMAFPADAGPHWVARIISFIIISGLLSALLWGVIAIARWANSDPRGKHWNMRGWLITTGVMVIVMQLFAMFASREQHADFRPAPQITEIRAEDRLPSGTVELLAISRHPSDGKWWRPDGTAWTEAPFENPGHTATPNKNQQGVEMVFRLPPGSVTNAVTKFKISGSTGSSGGSSPMQNGQPLPDGHFVATTFPKDLVSTDIAVGIGNRDNWETLMDIGPRAGSTASFEYQGKPMAVTLKSVTEDENGNVRVELAYDTRVEELRFIAVNQASKELRPTRQSASSRRMTATFAGASIDEIKSFRFQTLPFRWETFEDVWLSPRQDEANAGKLTQPGVRIDFQDVELIKRNGKERLEVIFTTQKNRAMLTWGTSGRFSEGAVDLISSASVTEQANGPAIIIHKESLYMPPSLGRDVVIRALKATREKWIGQSLVVLPGDKHTILSVEHAPGRTVALTVGSKIKDP